MAEERALVTVLLRMAGLKAGHYKNRPSSLDGHFAASYLRIRGGISEMSTGSYVS